VSNAANAALATQWKDLWNGDIGAADKIIAEDFLAHAAPLTGTGPDEIRGREALKGWISGIHTVLTSLTFAHRCRPDHRPRAPGRAVEGAWHLPRRLPRRGTRAQPLGEQAIAFEQVA
jgi:hypothetical protein